jgi:hypothetical protein
MYEKGMSDPRDTKVSVQTHPTPCALRQLRMARRGLLWMSDREVVTDYPDREVHVSASDGCDGHSQKLQPEECEIQHCRIGQRIRPQEQLLLPRRGWLLQ